MMKIAVDAMGGDNAPQAVIEGCVAALAEMDAGIILVGKEEVVRPELEKYKGMYDEDRVEIVHAQEVIENEDSPVKAVRTKKDSSLVMGIDMVKDGRASAMMSAGLRVTPQDGFAFRCCSSLVKSTSPCSSASAQAMNIKY